MNVLDIGCGGGIFSESLGRLGFGSVLGIDPTDKCIEVAREHLQGAAGDLKERVQYKNCTVEQLLE